jgi:hypothetical protein
MSAMPSTPAEQRTSLEVRVVSQQASSKRKRLSTKVALLSACEFGGNRGL